MAKIRKWCYYIRIVLSSIYFNFKYLPVKLAVRLPILLYKPKLISLKGRVIIDSANIHFGMIKLGLFKVPVYPNSGIVWENYGGSVIFKGRCSIGNNSAISIGPNGKIILGNNFIATTTLKLISYCSIEFKDNVLVGWENVFMDTNFHHLTDIKTGKLKRASGAIYIGANNWFTSRCVVLHSVKTPDFVIFGSNTVLTRNVECESYSIVAGNPPTVKATGVYRDLNNDQIDIYNPG